MYPNVKDNDTCQLSSHIAVEKKVLTTKEKELLTN